MKKYFKLLRFNNYIKNVLIFLPLVFSGSLFDITKLKISILAFFAFSMISSSVYIINDLKDVEKDRRHPVKKNRPIASGEISKLQATIICVICFMLALISIILGYLYINPNINIYVALSLVGIYFILNIGYSFGLKDIALIDIIILALGFVIRVLFGGAMACIEISSWLYLTILAISFYMGLGKRRNELERHKDKETRKVLQYYTKEFLDKNMYACMSLAIVFYSLWSKDSENSIMLWTVPIVIILAMRYSLNIESENSEGDPTEIILKDKFILLFALIYVAIVIAGLYIL